MDLELQVGNLQGVLVQQLIFCCDARLKVWETEFEM
jgi:hypothetical protein